MSLINDKIIIKFIILLIYNKFMKKQFGGKWSLKYKKSINCNRPKGFSQKQHCKYRNKNTRKNNK